MELKKKLHNTTHWKRLAGTISALAGYLVPSSVLLILIWEPSHIQHSSPPKIGIPKGWRMEKHPPPDSPGFDPPDPSICPLVIGRTEVKMPFDKENGHSTLVVAESPT